MSDRMTPLPLEKLYTLVYEEFKNKSTIFGIPTRSFFDARKYPKLAHRRYDQLLETPVGVAAGPHTQLSQNLIAAWLCGARYLELKTVQTLDELEVSKPCIDMEDEGYNCEWSQELKLEQSFNEYLNAWIMIHILKRELKLDANEELGCIFNMSVGYNMEGILKKNVQTFFKRMKDCSKELKAAKDKLRSLYPEIDDLHIPTQISNNITLSTMHGCPPDEIEKIGLYLINELGLETTVKLNPTLNGPSDLRDILNNRLGFKNTIIPNIAFEHDLKYPDGVKILKNLRAAAKKKGVAFGIKLTNTLESMNNKSNFDKKNEMMYMSGRPLHALALNVARKLQNEFNGELDITFSAGVDALNVAEVLCLNIKPITVCSDLLKPGGYERLVHYFENIEKKMESLGANTLDEMPLKSSGKNKMEEAILVNIPSYLANVLEDKRYHKKNFPWKTIKTNRTLESTDCIQAPCVKTCPTHQDVPSYMYLASEGRFEDALNVIRESNPFPNTTGMACDHICEDKCTRMNYDDTLKIRDIKRYIAMKETEFSPLAPKRKLDKKVAIIGGGPAGLSAAFYLALEGMKVELFEAHEILGGMITRALPNFRTYKDRVDLDIARIKSLGVTIHNNSPVNKDKFDKLRRSFDYIFMGIGASKSKKMGIPGEDANGVIGFLEFLEATKLGKLTELPKRVAIIGGGNSAIDAIRTAKRLVPQDGKAVMIYRRTVEEMPASREEIEELLEEKIEIMDLTAPKKIIVKDGKVQKISLIKMALGKPDESGRRRPHEIPESEFELDMDMIVAAIGQDVDTSFLSDLELNKNGTVFAKDNHESSLANIYVGGDLVHGPKSIIQGIADGKEAAYSIMENEGFSKEELVKPTKDLSTDSIKARRRYKEFGPVIPKTPLSKRNSFDVVIETFSDNEAQDEASRCLFCDEVCDVCVSVCPNRANASYLLTPKDYELADIEIKDKKVGVGTPYVYSLTQKNQVLNIGDYCNECGNCATFCPTAGRPYVDKPKLYLFKETYQAEKDNALIIDGDKLSAKYKGEKFDIKKTEEGFQVKTSICSFFFDKDFKVKEITPLKDGAIHLRHAIDLINILENY